MNIVFGIFLIAVGVAFLVLPPVKDYPPSPLQTMIPRMMRDEDIRVLTQRDAFGTRFICSDNAKVDRQKKYAFVDCVAAFKWQEPNP